MHKFEINYKNVQIEELKDIIVGGKYEEGGRIGHVKFGDEFDIDVDGTDSKMMVRASSSNNLRNEIISSCTYFDNDSKCDTPRSMGQDLQMEELRTLRVEVKELTREVEKLNKLKQKNKDLEYERKKLMKILKEYDQSRGEENYIITGCLYEVQRQLQQRWS